jgi:chorismate mutase
MLQQQLFDVTQVRLEAEIPAHCASDDAGWEAVTVMERFRPVQRAISLD